MGNLRTPCCQTRFRKGLFQVKKREKGEDNPSKVSYAFHSFSSTHFCSFTSAEEIPSSCMIFLLPRSFARLDLDYRGRLLSPATTDNCDSILPGAIASRSVVED